SDMGALNRAGSRVIVKADGVYLWDSDGNKVIDGMAGLWCVNVGYGRDSIVQAAAAQMAKLPYATGYFHFGSQPAIELAERLAALAPPSLNLVYFTLGGSDAIDSAVRFITHYFNATGRPSKKQMIALERGYHGSSS
ncbi:aminotransferase class III-fold pyridoxal phosphate-dependent enzyme, partial [Clostridioides difficile]|nr:aminotransferase class III-fold pyridoxal phosphate-dependent enzyme [Clostridioides difficile]